MKAIPSFPKVLSIIAELILLTSIIVVATSCSQAKNITYLQDLDRNTQSISRDSFHYKIKPKDLLSISVVSSEPEASRRYNLIAPQISSIDVPESYLYSQPMLQNYLVDDNGDINFPSFGKIHVNGLKKQELVDILEDKLKPYFIKELPIITIRVLNFSVNILGEVTNPGRFSSNNERMTIFEGLALAGDLTIYGKRENVKIIREDGNGDKKVYNVNLNNKSIFSSPVYFLEQNDVVYVEPNKAKSNSSLYGEADNYRVSTISILISLATMAISIIGLKK